MAKEDLSKRGKVGDTYRSGSFKKAKKRGAKTANLSAAQLKRAQTARGKKVSQKAVKRATAKRNETDISQTRFEKGKGVTKNGRLFTGTVKLASGKTATYVRGRRVVSGPKEKSGSGGSGAASRPTPKPNNNIPTSRVSPSARGEGSGSIKQKTNVARTATDSLMSIPRERVSPLGLGKSARKPKVPNRPSNMRGQKVRYDASKNRWVRVK